MDINPLVTFFNTSDSEIEIIENQWNKFSLIKWSNTTVTNKLWSEALQYKEELGIFALNILSLQNES